MLQLLFSLLLLAAATVESQCPAECSCPPSPPPCLLGVSWVSDRCGCCKVCARQFNEDCSAAEPCDAIKGLRCHLGAGGEPSRGLCRAEAHGLPCAFNGRVYQHGEDFQPVCQHQCTCMNGVVGCMPLCPLLLPPPPRRCSRPRLARPHGGCCEEWLCDDDNRISEEPPEPDDHQTQPQHSHNHPNHINALLELRPPPLQPPQHPDANTGDYGEPESFPVSARRCVPQSGAWSQCSASCGMGLSSRISNHNPSCELLREARLCQIRHCQTTTMTPPPNASRGKKCQRTLRPPEPVSLTFGGCSTPRRYRPRSCGGCSDGRCCSPSQSRTVRLRFHCPEGDTIYNVLWIQRCICRHDGCSQQDANAAAAAAAAASLYNDIHTFRD